MRNRHPLANGGAYSDCGEPGSVVVVPGRGRQPRISYNRVREYPGSYLSGDSQHVRIKPSLSQLQVAAATGQLRCCSMPCTVKTGKFRSKARLMRQFFEISLLLRTNPPAGPRNSTLMPLRLPATRPSRQRPVPPKLEYGMEINGGAAPGFKHCPRAKARFKQAMEREYTL